MICQKCGKFFPDTLKPPIRCFCDTKQHLEIDSTIVNNPINSVDSISIENNYILMQRKLWEELHTYQYINETETKQWLMFFTSRVPCGECKNHWIKLMVEFPPDFSSEDNFFEWTVKAHNMVNKRLDKPEISIEEAKNLWRNT